MICKDAMMRIHMIVFRKKYACWEKLSMLSYMELVKIGYVVHAFDGAEPTAWSRRVVERSVCDDNIKALLRLLREKRSIVGIVDRSRSQRPKYFLGRKRITRSILWYLHEHKIPRHSSLISKLTFSLTQAVMQAGAYHSINSWRSITTWICSAVTTLGRVCRVIPLCSTLIRGMLFGAPW